MKKRLINKAFDNGGIYKGEYLPFITRNTKYVRYAKRHPELLRPFFVKEFGKSMTDNFYRKEV